MGEISPAAWRVKVVEGFMAGIKAGSEERGLRMAGGGRDKGIGFCCFCCFCCCGEGDAF